MLYIVYENRCIHKGKENELEVFTLHLKQWLSLGDGNGVLGMQPGVLNNRNFNFNRKNFCIKKKSRTKISITWCYMAGSQVLLICNFPIFLIAPKGMTVNSNPETHF